MADKIIDTTLTDVENNPESSPLHLMNQLIGSSETSLNTTTTTTTTTTELRRSSRQAAKKSGFNATPLDMGNDSTPRTQLAKPVGSKKDPRPGSNATTQDVELKPPHRLIEIIEPAQSPQAHNKNQQATLNKPCSLYLSDEQKEKYMKICVPLQSAAIRGDWHAAEGILSEYPEAINMSITHKEDTLLHIVSSTKHTHFANKLVNKLNVEDLKLQNKEGATALWLAVASTVNMVAILLKKDKGLLKIRTNGSLPLMCAVWSGHKDIVELMYSKTDIADEKWKESDKKSILNSCIAAGLFDIALKIINHCKEEGTLMKIGTEVLRYLAYKPAAFDGKMRPFIRRLVNTILPGPRQGTIDNSPGLVIVRIMWGEIVKQKHEDILKTIAGDSKKKQVAGDSKKKQVAGDSKKKEVAGDSKKKQVAGDSKKKQVEGLLFIAARLGNYKFIIELLKLYPEIAWERDDNKYTIFHVAVIHRHENVYNLLYELGSKKLGTLDKDKNNILHLAAKKPAQSRLNIVSGAALQMQRELLWFKEVKTRVNSADSRKWNNDNKSPQDLFTEQHACMVKEGEEWMKHTGAQCMVVAALIATIMFAAAFTLPGGNNGDSGHPIFLKKSAFIVFAVADGISLCTSSASILMFLAILTARYTEDDFLVSLPMKLMIGLVTLFVSIATMMISFSASFFLLYAENMIWIPVLVSTLAGVPVILFAVLQYGLLVDVIKSTIMARHLFRPNKHLI